MGKDKDVGRSKTRPSSSSLAASLLPTGGSSVGFGGYLGGTRVEPPVSSIIEDVASPFQAVDPELSQHLKRLGRKDSKTKLKALAALSKIFSEGNGEDIVHIIPLWAFEYKKLLNDYNRDVRRATNETMTSLVISVRRGLAPYLKSLIGPWWFSQFDQVFEISQAARRSFEAAFPAQEKRLDALIISSNEVLIYLDENLKLTPQTMSDKATPMDELEDMHQHVLSSSLLAMATLIHILAGEKRQAQNSEDITQEAKVVSKARVSGLSFAEKMFNDQKYFLEFLKSKTPRVRSATYSILFSFVKHIPNFLDEGNSKLLSIAILGSLQEKDASCHSSMWDMILLFSQRYPDCWFLNNVQKNSLARLWQFLRNECYGSQEISYPVLVLFLDSLPAKIVVQEHFLSNFLQNMWKGRNPFQSQATNPHIFFTAFKECFLWGLYKTSRYVPVDEKPHFQHSLVENILIKLLWGDYFSLVPGNLQYDHSFGKPNNSSEDAICRNNHPKSANQYSKKYPKSYLQNLGKCLVEILSNIYLKDSTLLHAFCSTFQKDSLEVLHKGESLPRFSDSVERITNFFLMMNQLGVVKDQDWPLNDLAGPLVVNCLPLINSLDSEDFVKLLVIMSDIFGPKIIVLNCFVSTKRQYCNEFINESRRESSNTCFLQVFNDEIIPWCLHKLSHSTSLKLDLLISLLDDEHFFKQWNLIIEYSTKLLNCSGNEKCASDAHVIMLATLLEKVRSILENKKTPTNLKGQNGCLPEHWQHALLDMAVVSVLSQPSSLSASHGNFIRAAIGGSSENNQICFLSMEALVSIYETVLRNLITFIGTSSHSWALSASSLLLSASGQNLKEKIVVSEIKHIEKAQFSIEVLDGSIFCLRNLHMDSNLLPCILATLFLIEWGESLLAKVHVQDYFEGSEYLLGGVDTSVLSDEASDSEKKVDSKLFLSEKVIAIRSKIIVNILRCFDPCNLMILRNILIQTVRTAIFETETPFKDKMPALCCNWILDILQVICRNPADEQNALDQLLSENEYWPIWVSPNRDCASRSIIQASQNSSIDSHKPRHDLFVAFVEKLIACLGVSKIVAGFSEHSSSCNAETTENRLSSVSYTRSWIAAELLCTWNWSGKCALESFLYLLNDYAKKSSSSFKESLIFSVVVILLDASILHGASSHMNFFNVWTASDDEIESIHDPYLRALISLLSALIVKDDTWKKYEASLLFEHIVDKLFVGTNINQSCLRVLPFVLNIISQPLIKGNAKHDEASENFQHDYVDIDSIRRNIVSWLQSALALPSLTFENTQNQDLEEWIQLIVSCYPLSIKGPVGSFNAAEIGYIDQLERALLLSLFRKQRYDDDAVDISMVLSPSSSFNLEASSRRSAQMMLVKLTAVSVAYCWHDFNDDDWDFALGQLDRWIKSLVLVMEAITEKVDDIVTSSDLHTEETMTKLNLAVQIFDPLPLSISKTALIVLSLFSRIFSSKEVNANRVLPSILKKWNSRRDGIFEDVLRLFLATGAAEAIASYVSKEASTVIAASRHAYSNLWELVATCVINSPQHIRTSSAQSMDLWGLSVGPVASLYAILFSCEPLSSLQLAAYNLLSTEPICQISLLKEDKNALSGQDSCTDHNSESFSEESCNLREEISSIIENPHPVIFEDDLLASHRVNYFIGWALMLSYLQSLPPPSKARERIILHVQDSVSSTILHCIFQHIPLKYGFSNNLKRKDVELPVEVSRAANSANQAIRTSSLSYAVESLWPVEADQMAVLAGSIYGSMIHLLPAYVRNWFTGLRDRAFTSSVESFTKTWCSPPLITDEFTQMKGEGLADDNFSVTVNKSAYEIIATYKKEDTGMDLVIRLPICYPLRPVDVACTRSLGISEVKQRKWLLSLNAFVRNQNGAIAEAMRTWKKNFDKEFQGVEECPICYSIIHTTNHSLPRLACKTCKHKFHSACLYKWFSTSNKSTCPLCQMPF